MSISNLQKYYNNSINSVVKSNLREIIKKEAWFQYYLQFISYEDDLGWVYNGECFSSLDELRCSIAITERVKFK
jgi:hypothetical protein